MRRLHMGETCRQKDHQLWVRGLSDIHSMIDLNIPYKNSYEPWEINLPNPDQSRVASVFVFLAIAPFVLFFLFRFIQSPVSVL